MGIASELYARRDCYYSYGNRYYCRSSSWYHWGRWVLLAALILCSIFVLSIIACINSRRRRQRGAAPVYGTGWMAPLPKYSQQPAPGHQSYGGAPPAGGYYAPPPPVYGGQQDGIQLQPPQQAYRGASQEEQYAPPAGPPPGK